MTDNRYGTPATRADLELRALHRLAGPWRVSGGATGTVTYRWLEGGHFLAQDIDLTQNGQRIVGMEIIGRSKPFGAEKPGEDILSHFYDNEGNTFDYVYDPSDDGDTLTIWAGEKGSPAFYQGTFSPDGDTLSGSWTYPGGGGYSSVMTRVR
ncbi:hypothetical protein [Streptomyces clavuligerus]|uniref:DUF1579 domain-containing protein n=1 Tax=Streptomyces clavuligerus TaxID=1901 RepID=B5GMY8_STRCL|nr:hypothetical protein [Streptomyces clavuligerus]ANW22255.1 hypothetical protein BB341_28395 [Streptomyces clavuligerus]AXU17150.1 hypothetical protein D1794_31455 [Streptomyces clavuligerus]EDY47684.1 conserved hypothetical protein [Streptomyces clavuligerus]EFG04323.1 Hypothetical protein SCLAV_p0837 [Streptomyces clavuligerus]MBY6307203.1 hypothetical protein [Streptomyces clavuligerus]